MASTVEHGSGQQTRGPNPSLPTSIRYLERFGRKRTVESAKGCPKSPNLDSGPPPASPPNHGSPSPRITVSILMPAAGDQTASDLTTPRSTDIFAAGLA